MAVVSIIIGIILMIIYLSFMRSGRKIADYRIIHELPPMMPITIYQTTILFADIAILLFLSRSIIYLVIGLFVFLVSNVTQRFYFLSILMKCAIGYNIYSLFFGQGQSYFLMIITISITQFIGNYIQRKTIQNLQGTKFNMKDNLEYPEDKIEKTMIEAENGVSDAQFLLGSLYFFGTGVTQDYEEAVKWLTLGAEQGNKDAQFLLGGCYEFGYGVEKDNKESVRWCKLAAEQGSTEAQCTLGETYYVGNGVVQDYNEALKWFLLALKYSSGDFYKLALEGKLKTKKELTKEQIEKATREAKEIQKRIEDKDKGICKHYDQIRNKLDGGKMSAKEIVIRRRDEIDEYLGDMIIDGVIYYKGIYPISIDYKTITILLQIFFLQQDAFKKILIKNRELLYDFKLIKLIYSRVRFHKKKIYGTKNNRKIISADILDMIKKDIEELGLNWDDLSKKEKYIEVIKKIFTFDTIDSYGEGSLSDFVNSFGNNLLIYFYLDEMDIELS